MTMPLQSDADLLRALLESIPDAVYFKDLESRFVRVSDALVQWLGLSSPDDLIGLTDADIFSAKDAARMRGIEEQIIETGEPVRDLEETGMLGDGKQIVALTTKMPLRNAAGEIVGTWGISRNMTELRRAQQALQRMRRHEQQLLTALPSICIGLDQNFVVSQWNQRAQEVLGVATALALRHQLRSLPIDWPVEKIEEALRTSAASRKTIPCELTVVGKGGRQRRLGLSVQGICSVDGGLDGYVIVGADITDRELRESQFRLNSRMQSLGEMAAGVAHEINTPMQYIVDNIGFLQEANQESKILMDALRQLEQAVRAGHPPGGPLTQQLDAVGEAYEKSDIEFLEQEVPLAMEHCQEGVDRVSTIVRAMRAFTHPGLKTIEPADLNSQVTDTVTISRSEWKYVAEVELDLQEDLPLVECNVGEVNQVLLNLIVNAAQAIAETAEGASSKGKIRIVTRDRGEYAEIRISDTGPGIPAEVADRVFDLFFTTKAPGFGTGQGLAVAHNVIVNRHGGEIFFQSPPGGGTTFIVRLPLQSPKRSPAAAA